MSDAETWAEYAREIDRRLDALRPKYSNAGDKDWREPVYGWARNHIPDESNLVRRFAEREVDRREGQATRRANDYLRSWAKGNIPLFWADLGPLPIRANGIRIRLDAATPDDIEDAARELRSNAKQIYDEVLILSESLEDLARSARRAGLSSVAGIGDQEPRGAEVTEDGDDLDYDDWAEEDAS